MKLETLKKNNKKKIFIGGVIVFALISVIGFTATRAKYKSIQNMKLANGTIKYTSSDLKLIAMYQANSEGTYDAITSVPSSGYILNTEKSSCKVNEIKDTSIEIEYIDGKINIANLTKKGTKCYLYFDIKTTETINTSFGTIVAKLASPDFSQVATEDEGIFQMADGMYGGTSYYWRGAATTNHVIFADKCWRIVRINGDGSIRLIYNGAQNGTGKCKAIGDGATIMGATNEKKYFATADGQANNSSYAGWTYTLSEQRSTTDIKDSNAKTQTEKWYSENITGTNVDKVADGYFCGDRNTGEKYPGWEGWEDYTTEWSATGKKFAYAGVDRLTNNFNPTLSCPEGDKYTLKVGAITADEVVMVGGKYWTTNSSYYLYTGQQYWTMSPSDWNSAAAAMFIALDIGTLGRTYVNATTFGLRPVINLRAETVFAIGGNGTTDNPYIVQ